MNERRGTHIALSYEWNSYFRSIGLGVHEVVSGLDDVLPRQASRRARGTRVNVYVLLAGRASGRVE